MAAMRSWAKAVYLAARPYQAPTAAPLPSSRLSVAASSQRRLSACKSAFMSGPEACGAARVGTAAGAGGLFLDGLARPLPRAASAGLAAGSGRSGSRGLIARLLIANYRDTEPGERRTSVRRLRGHTG